MIPTAKQYFEENLSGEPLTQEAVIEALQDFAKLHLQAQQEAILENVRMRMYNYKGSHLTEKEVIDDYTDIEVDKDSIINAYNINNIK